MQNTYTRGGPNARVIQTVYSLFLFSTRRSVFRMFVQLLASDIRSILTYSTCHN
jgi:hypothetical protein